MGWFVFFSLRLVIGWGLGWIFIWVEIRLLNCLVFKYIGEKFVVFKGKEINKRVIISIVNRVCNGSLIIN